jgi:RNA polymerase sigma-70 factor, ECF subfamily
VDDHSAIRHLKQGDIDALGVLVNRYQLEAVRTAYLITRDKSLAEDAVQEAFLRAYRYIRQFDESRPFAPWLMRIVVNVAVQMAQRREILFADHDTVDAISNFEAGDFLERLPDSAMTPEDAAEAAETGQIVWNALEALSPSQRALIVMRYYFDFSERELSESFGVPRGTISWRLSTARQKLQDLLQRSPLTLSFMRKEKSR